MHPGCLDKSFSHYGFERLYGNDNPKVMFIMVSSLIFSCSFVSSLVCIAKCLMDGPCQCKASTNSIWDATVLAIGYRIYPYTYNTGFNKKYKGWRRVNVTAPPERLKMGKEDKNHEDTRCTSTGHTFQPVGTGARSMSKFQWSICYTLSSLYE